MPRLPDGSFAPKYFGVASYEDRSSLNKSLIWGNSDLRIGFVVGFHDPGDPGCEALTERVYDIYALTAQSGGAESWLLYPKATLGMGGSSNDFARMTLRVPRGWVNGTPIKENIERQATKVVFACQNGRADKAVILGFAHHAASPLDEKSLGHYFRQDFNGISTVINRDGEYSTTFTGAILDENTNFHIDPPPETTGTYFKFLKDGSWTVNDVKGESISLDKTNKKVNIQARSMDTATTEGAYNVTSKGNTYFKADANAIFDGKKVYIGKEGSKDPLVLGNKLVEAFTQLLAAFTDSPFIGQAGPFPTFMHPTLRAALNAWKNVYGRKNTSPFLSKKGYVE